MVVITDRGPDFTITKAGHGLAVGGTYTDDNSVAHEVYEVVSANQFRVVRGSADPTPASGDTSAAYTASDWNARAIGNTGLTYKAIAPRPGTSAFASERFLSYDEVHVAVVDTATNTIVERLTYLSKYPMLNLRCIYYWKDAVNEYSSCLRWCCTWCW